MNQHSMSDFRAGYNPEFERKARAKQRAKAAAMKAYERERNRLAQEKLRKRDRNLIRQFTPEKTLLFKSQSVVQERWTMREIADLVCITHGITRTELEGYSREKRFVLARQQFCYWARSLTACSLPQIAAVINRDHTTVLHSINKYGSKFRRVI